MQVAQQQLQEKESQHSAYRFEQQALGLQHIPKGGCQPDLLNQRRHHCGACGQNDGAVHRRHRPVQTGQPMGRQQSGTE